MRLRKPEQASESLNVVVRLKKRIVDGGIGDRRFVKDRVEGFIPELRVPIQSGNIRGYEIPPEATQISEVPRTKIIDHNDARLGMTGLKFPDEIGSDEARPTGDENIAHDPET